jgi:large repetitive protein
MKRMIFFLIAFTAVLSYSQAGTGKGFGGPDASGYTWLDSDETGGPVYNWVEISSTGTQIVLGEDAVSAEIPVGFDFPYYGISYDSLKIYSDGILSFNGPNNNYYPGEIPSTSFPFTNIAPFWCNLDPSAGGAIYYYSDIANGRFIVQFDSIQELYFPTNIYTFQVILESSGSIYFQYKEIIGDTEYCSIGIQNGNGTVGLQVVYFSTYLKNSLAVEFVPAESPYGGTISLSNSSLSYGNVAVCEAAYQTFTISNTSTTKILQGDIQTIAGYTVSTATKNTLNFEVPASSSRQFDLLFYPTAATSYNGYIIINSSDTASPVDSIYVSGTGVYPNAGISLTDTLRSEVYVGGSKNETFDITNTGLGNLEYSTRRVLLNKGSGSDSFGNTWKDSDASGGPVYYWRDISCTGTPLSLTDESISAEISLGFNFTFYGNTYSTVRISSNGFLSFTSTDVAPNNFQIPNTSTPNNILAVFWDDLNPGAKGQVYYYYDSVLKRFIVQYNDIPLVGQTGGNTFQAILYSDGTIVYQYYKLSGPLNFCTVGIENSTGTVGINVVHNASYLKNSLAIAFTPPQTGWVSASPKRGYIAASNSQTVTMSFNSSGLTAGKYYGNLYIDSTDPDTPTITVPVKFTVMSIIPAVPANVTTSVISGNIFINWDDSANATSYDVYYSANPYGTFTFLTNVAVSQYTYTPGTNSKMFFRIVAKNSTKVSPEYIEIPERSSE